METRLRVGSGLGCEGWGVRVGVQCELCGRARNEFGVVNRLELETGKR